MPYSTQADVQNACGGLTRLKQLVDWDNDGTADVAAIADAIAEVDALVDTFASKQFTVPFNPVPPIIRRTSASLAKLTLARRRRQLTQEEADEWERLAGTDKQKPGWLLLLATGVVTPGGDPLPSKHGSMAVDEVDTALPGDRDASREKLGGFW